MFQKLKTGLHSIIECHFLHCLAWGLAFFSASWVTFFNTVMSGIYIHTHWDVAKKYSFKSPVKIKKNNVYMQCKFIVLKLT